MIGDFPKSFFLYEIIIWSILIGIPTLLLIVKRKSEKRAKFLKTLLILIWCIVFYGSFIEPRILIVREVEKDIPGFPELKLAIVSDIHVGPYKKEEWVKKIVSEVNKRGGLDIVLIPGDFLFGGVGKYGKYLEPLSKSRYPVYAVLGNHDHGETKVRDEYQAKGVSKILKKVGVKELKNKAVFIEDKKFWIVGVDDNYYGFHSLENAFGDTDAFPQILLAHSPDIIDDLKGKKYNPKLIISGHTHGGQNSVPFLGALPYTIPTKNGKSLEKGWRERDGQIIFITTGVGEVGPRSRFFNLPEIVILKINQK